MKELKKKQKKLEMYGKRFVDRRKTTNAKALGLKCAWQVRGKG